MKAHELYLHAAPSVFDNMFKWFREEDRDLYKTALATLASNRKLRPVFVQKKPVAEQISWMIKTLQLKSSEMLGEHLLQAYLMKAHADILVTFCDGVGIEHDGKGSVEGDLPKQLDADKLSNTTDVLLAKYDPDLVRVYLHVFNMQTNKGWASLTKLLEGDERVKIIS